MNGQLPWDTTPQPNKLDVAEKIIKIALAAFAVFYAMGLLVTNEYLLGLGVTDFSSVRPKYMLTGFWVSLFVALSAMPFCIVLLNFHKKLIPDLWMFIKAFAGVALLTISFAYTLKYPVSSNKLNLTKTVCELVVFATIWLFCTVCLYFMNLAVVDVVRKGVFYFLIVLIVVLWLSKSTEIIAVTFYSRVPQELGGGCPLRAKILLNDNGKKFWGTLTEFSEKSLDKVGIMYQDEKVMVLFITPINKQVPIETMILGKDMVGAITLLKQDQYVCD